MPVPEDAGAPSRELRARFASGAVLIPVALAASWFGPPYFDLFIAAAAVLLSWEWVGLCRRERLSPAAVIFPLVIVAVLGAAALDFQALTALLLVGGMVAIFVLAIRPGIGAAGWMTAGAAYIAIPCVALIWLRGGPDSGRVDIFWLFAVVWAGDIGAYAVGRLIGGPRLAPALSPNKTWAGFAGGMFAAIAAGLAVGATLGPRPWVIILALSAIVGLFGQVGDLLESGIKRHFGVKDMGKIIPGHGGVFDRVDGLLLAAPAALILISVLDGGF